MNLPQLFKADSIKKDDFEDSAGIYVLDCSLIPDSQIRPSEHKRIKAIMDFMQLREGELNA